LSVAPIEAQGWPKRRPHHPTKIFETPATAKPHLPDAEFLGSRGRGVVPNVNEALTVWFYNDGHAERQKVQLAQASSNWS
jgi:hypothetical protein